MSSPVFLISSVRSGSTFLKLMLDHHPDISAPGEFDFMFDMISDDGDFPDINDYIEFLETNRIFLSKNLKIDPKLDFSELILSFIKQLKTKKYLVLNIHRNFHRILYLFPDAQFIYLVRDPRDVARSTIPMGWAGNVYYGVDIWTKSHLSWLNLEQQINSDNVITVKYEDILYSQENNLTIICDFIGTNFSQRIYEYVDNSTYSKPDPSLCYQWKRKYTKKELELVEGKISDQLERYGYDQVTNGRYSPTKMQRIFLYINNKNYTTKFHIKRLGILLWSCSKFAQIFKIKALQNKLQPIINEITIKHLK